MSRSISLIVAALVVSLGTDVAAIAGETEVDYGVSLAVGSDTNPLRTTGDGPNGLFTEIQFRRGVGLEARTEAGILPRCGRAIAVLRIGSLESGRRKERTQSRLLRYATPNASRTGQLLRGRPLLNAPQDLHRPDHGRRL